MAIEIGEESRDGATLLTPVGRLDSESSELLDSAVARHLDGGALKLAIDFREVDYISSAGLRVVLMAAKRLKAAGGSLVLCSMQPSVRLVFELAGLLPLFAVEPDRAAAFARLRAAP